MVTIILYINNFDVKLEFYSIGNGLDVLQSIRVYQNASEPNKHISIGDHLIHNCMHAEVRFTSK